MQRRSFLSALSAAPALAQAPRDWTQPTRYPEPDVVVLDKSFQKYKIGNSPILRLATNISLWAEGCAWNAVGRYVMWSDIPNDRQMRWLDDGSNHVSVLRAPAGNSNGNTFDWEGRQISCEHGTRRVTRYEHNGTVTVLAERYNGKRLNAPNDAVVAPDGGIWFTDPGYGSLMNYEGNKGPLEIKEAVYRIDKTGKIEMVTDEIYKPNGLCFSPDYKKLYVADTGSTHNEAAPKNIKVWDVDGTKLRNGREFVSMALNGKAGIADGIRCDTDGNIWASAGWVGAGYDGVHIFSPQGQRIGQILLPEICSNLCFAGVKRNRVFMTGSQSIYAVYVEAQGAHFC
jgi:gluconolactonase